MCGGGKKAQTKAKKTKLAKSKTTVNPVLPRKKKCYLKIYVLRSDTDKALPDIKVKCNKGLGNKLIKHLIPVDATATEIAYPETTPKIAAETQPHPRTTPSRSSRMRSRTRTMAMAMAMAMYWRRPWNVCTNGSWPWQILPDTRRGRWWIETLTQPVHLTVRKTVNAWVRRASTSSAVSCADVHAGQPHSRRPDASVGTDQE